MKFPHWFLIIGVLIPLLAGRLTLAQDAAQPEFSNPANVTNPYCPKSLIQHSIALGQEGGSTLRIEETLLPTTRTLEWGGGTIEAIVTYYMAFGDGHLIETAFDYYGQDDAGNLYYLGEEVTNYRNGQVLNHEGSWLVGRDGAPPGLLMPANLAVGMTWHPENRPGLVDEEVKVLNISETAATPRGPISDGIRIQEILMNGHQEIKIWARGFCEVVTDANDEYAQLALINYTTDEHRPIPDPLATLEEAAEAIFDYAPNADWDNVVPQVQTLQDAWSEFQEKNNDPQLPAAFQDAMTVALKAVQGAVAAKDITAALQSANDVSFAVTDLFTYYNPMRPTDLLRMDALERQVLLDLKAGDLVAATDTLTQAAAIWVRLRPQVQAQDGGSKATLEFETSLNKQVAAVANNVPADATQAATKGLELVDVMERVF